MPTSGVGTGRYNVSHSHSGETKKFPPLFTFEVLGSSIFSGKSGALDVADSSSLMDAPGL